MDIQPLLKYAQRHHQLVTRDVASQLGVSKSTWYWAIRSDRLEAVHPGIARIAGSPTAPEQEILAAVWACGEGAKASHRSAAHLWCPVDPPRVIDVTMTRDRRGPSLPRVVIHRPRDLVDLRTSIRLNIPATNPLRALVDLGAVDPDGVRPFLERVVVAGFVTPRAVIATLERHRQHGRNGVAVLDAVMRDWTMNEKPPDSVLEEAMNAFALRFGFPEMKFHAEVEGYEVDFLVLGTPVVIECDGWSTHGLERDQFEFDRERDQELVAAGYVVVHVTWRQLRRRPASFARRLRKVLSRFIPDLGTGGSRW